MTDVGIGWLALSTSLLAASTFSVFAKILSPALSPLSLVFISECIVLLCVLLSFGGMPVARTFLSFQAREMLWLSVVGILSGILGPTLWFIGLTKTSVINAGFFGKSEILFMLVSAALIFHERMTRAHILAVCSIMAGMAIISLRGFTDGLTFQVGDVIIVGGTLSFALSSVILRKFLPHMQPHMTIVTRSLTALVAFAIMTPFIPHTFFEESLALPAVLLPALLGFGFISRFINGFMYYEALERLPISTISLVGSLDVILSTIMAYAVLGEPILWYHFLGGGFVLLGTLLLELLGTHPTSRDLEQHIRQKHL